MSFVLGFENKTVHIPSILHNEIRDLTAKVLTENCHNVGTESPLQPVNDEHSLPKHQILKMVHGLILQLTIF